MFVNQVFINCGLGQGSDCGVRCVATFGVYPLLASPSRGGT